MLETEGGATEGGREGGREGVGVGVGAEHGAQTTRPRAVCVSVVWTWYQNAVYCVDAAYLSGHLLYANAEGVGTFWEVLQGSLQCVPVSTTVPYFESGELEKNMFGKVFGWAGWGLGLSEGLEGLTIGHDIILCRLLKIGNFGTQLVT